MPKFHLPLFQVSTKEVIKFQMVSWVYFVCFLCCFFVQVRI